MAFTQQTFLGASIRSFNGTIGWGGTPSKVTVQLVEDPKNGDSFTPVIGTPVLFSYSGWTFGGIVKSFTQDGGSGGNPLYTVIIEDPRSILNGTEIILNNYTGSTYGVPNLLNVYGYLESAGGFGASRVNSAGIPWKNVRDGIIALTSGANNTYGNNIVLGSYSYEIDLSELPNLPDYYRISAQDRSIMAFIQEICDAANHEFYFSLSTIGIVNTIKLHTIDRNQQPVFGAITDFVTNTNGAVAKNVGLEFRDEVTSKFLVGGNVSEIYHNSLTGGDDEDFETGTDNNIWPYWGTYSNGNVVIGEGINNNHKMLLDSSWVLAWPFATYPTDVGELRAALGGQSSWQTYLWLHNFNIYTEDAYGNYGATYRNPEQKTTAENEYYYTILRSDYDGYKAGYVFGDIFNDQNVLLRAGTGAPGDTKRDKARYLPLYTKNSQNNVRATNSWYKHNNELNPHFGKATILNAGSSSAAVLAGFLSGNPKTLSDIVPNALAAFDKRSRKGNAKSQEDKNKERSLYEYVKAYAEEYYGKRFMVRIPFVLAATDQDTGEVRLSREVADGGFLEESAFPTAISTNLLAPDVNKFTLEDGRITAYVRYLNADQLDFGDINVDDISFNESTNTAFVKVNVEKEIQYVDRSLLYSPRVVVEMPGIVRPIAADGNSFAGVVKDFLVGKFREYGNPNPDAAAEAFFKRGGGDVYRYDKAGIAILPNDADIPLQSNITTYGPWYAAGANGKLDFEQDSSLVPWNYGGFTAMNNTANARIQSAISNVQVSEAGSIEFPGTPTINMGSQLQSSGPYITDINVQISDRGVTTTYQMKTWTPQPYKLRKEQAEQGTKAAVQAQRLRREMRADAKLAEAKGRASRIKASKFGIGKPKTDSSSTTHTMITGEVVPGSGDDFNVMVGIQPQYNTSTELSSDNYVNKGGMSLDGLFQPFSMEIGTNLPTVETGSGDSPNANDLNQFLFPTTIDAVINGTVPRDISIYESTSGVYSYARPMALKGPLIISGPGYDTDGNPTPVGSGQGGFPVDIFKKPNLWKTGPLDARWDHTKKMWIASGGSNLYKIKAAQTIPAAIGEYSGTRVDDGSDITIDNFLKQPLASGANALGWKNGEVYHILQAEFSETTVVSDITCVSGSIEVCTITNYTQVNTSGEACG